MASCGGGGTRAAPPPKLPHELASALARQADAVAASLERGNACAARAEAERLRRAVTAGIGEVPGALQEDLSAGANILLDKIRPCVLPAPAEEQHGKKKGHDKHKHKDKGKGRGKREGDEGE